MTGYRRQKKKMQNKANFGRIKTTDKKPESKKQIQFTGPNNIRD